MYIIHDGDLLLISQTEKYFPQARQRICGKNLWGILKDDRCSAGGPLQTGSNMGHVANAILHF